MRVAPDLSFSFLTGPPTTDFYTFPYTTLFRSPPVEGASPAAVLEQVMKGSVVPPSLRVRSEEHTSELQSRPHLVCRLLLEKKNDHQARTRNASCVAQRVAHDPQPFQVQVRIAA